MKNPDHVKRSVQRENQQREERFLRIASEGNWHLLKRGDVFQPSAGESEVIGIAVWSHPEMELLENLAKTQRDRANIYVFSFGDASDFTELSAFLPQVQLVSQTPVVGEYRDGRLVRQLEGQAARDWLEGHTK